MPSDCSQKVFAVCVVHSSVLAWISSVLMDKSRQSTQRLRFRKIYVLMRPFWETLEDFQTEPPLWLHPNFLKMTSINFTCCERDPYPNILARNWAEVHQMLNIYSSVKRSVFYIIHSFCHRSLHERSFCTIGNTTDYSFCMLNVVL